MAIQFRRGTANSWATSTEVLLPGQPGAAVDTGEVRVGDGVRTWSALPSNSATSKVNKGELVLNVADYGTFVGNGAVSTGTADVAAVNAALAAAESVGATVLIPARARITAIAPSLGTLITARKGVTLRSEGAVIKIADGSPPYNAVIGSPLDVSGFTLDGITIDQNKDNTAAVSLAQFQYAFGVYLVNGTNLRVRNCTFRNVDGINTIVMNGSSGTNGLVNVGNVFVTDNTFVNVGTSTTHDHSTVYTVATSATITGNHFFGRATVADSAICAIEVHGSAHRVTDNHIENYREAINATGIAYKTDTQVVANNTIARCLRGIRGFSQGLAGTVSPAIRAMNISGNSIIIDPDFWAPVHDLAPQGISFTSTSDLAVHGLNIQNNNIVVLPYTGNSPNMATALGGGIVYSRTGGMTNYDRAFNFSGNTVTGSLSGGIICFGLKVQGMVIADNLILDPGHPSLVTSDEYRAGISLFGEAVATSVHHNRIADTRTGGGTARGVAWFVSAGSVDGEIVDNAITLVGFAREIRVNAGSGSPLVRHLLRTAGGNPALPVADTAVGSEWTIRSTGIKSVQRKAPAGQVWVGPSATTALRPAAADVGAGFSVHDTTLGKPIWSTGSGWVDASGAAV